MSDDGFDQERPERTARTAGELLDLALGASDGDLDRALRDVAPDDAPAVLAAMARELAGLMAAQRLRDVEPADDDDPVAADGHGDGTDVVSDDELPADPWELGDATSNALEHAATLWEALAEQQRVADLLRAVGALDPSEAVLMVFERSLRELAERQRPR